ncbi:UNVERIFIED_CONTAM: hypothetical protein GTU68_056102 [Idotea baltica]|nr:hypothetical protein [Idotea baltica]
MLDWKESKSPSRSKLLGQYCRLEPLNISLHADDLYEAYGNDQDQSNWTYLPYGPFENKSDFIAWLEATSLGNDPLFYTVIDSKTNKAVGVATYLRINPKDGVIEVGHIHFSPLMQQTPISTEAMFLMMKYVFNELGYRRYEWKCDSLNRPSRAAALRLGFQFEGIFRQLTIYKGRNRDTAWFGIIDKDWPMLESAFNAWLNPQNFDGSGKQLASLSSFQSKL